MKAGLALLVALTAALPATAQARRAPLGERYGEGEKMYINFVVAKHARLRSFALGILPGGPCAAGNRLPPLKSVRLTRRGTFRYSADLGIEKLTLRGRVGTHGRFSGTYRAELASLGGGPRCKTGTLRWTAGPVTRVAVKDGPWHGTSQSGGPVTFTVIKGGRLINDASVDAQPRCSDGQSTNAGNGHFDIFGGSIFIKPDGSFSTPAGIDIDFIMSAG